MTAEKRIAKAIEIALEYGQIDGDHHKAWTIDQIVRALTGCPMVKKLNPRASTPDGKGFMTIEYEGQGESKEYIKLITEYKAGEDGPDTYAWDEGIAP